VAERRRPAQGRLQPTRGDGTRHRARSHRPACKRQPRAPPRPATQRPAVAPRTQRRGPDRHGDRDPGPGETGQEPPAAGRLAARGNNEHGDMTGRQKGVEVNGVGTPSWTAEYRRRVGGIMDTVTRAHAFLVWIGLPITRDEAQTRRFDTINAIVESEARKRA